MAEESDRLGIEYRSKEETVTVTLDVAREANQSTSLFRIVWQDQRAS